MEAKAEAYINYYEKFGMDTVMLDSALKYISRNNSNAIRKNIKRLVHVYYLKNDFKTVISFVQQIKDISQLVNKQKIDNSDAWTCYRIAESYQQLGSDVAAEPWLAQAYNLAPLFPDFENKYGSVLASLGKTKEAKSIFENLVKEHPEYAPGFSNLGFLVLSQEGNSAKAESCYRRAIYLDPDYISALLNMAGLYMFQKNKQQAILYLNEVLKLSPNNKNAKAALQQLKNGI